MRTWPVFGAASMVLGAIAGYCMWATQFRTMHDSAEPQTQPNIEIRDAIEAAKGFVEDLSTKRTPILIAKKTMNFGEVINNSSDFF